jgi:hypothetical protein
MTGNRPVPETEIVLYQSDDGSTRIDVRMADETVWLSLDQMAALFQRDKSTVSRHISNVFSEGELGRRGTVADFATVQTEGSRQVARQVTYYNLDVIISVRCRVKSAVSSRRERTCIALREAPSPREPVLRPQAFVGRADGRSGRSLADCPDAVYTYCDCFDCFV